MAKIITVDFRQDTLFAVERDDGVFVAVKPIVQALGLDWKAQHRRLSDDAILSEGMVTMTMPSVGGMQDTTCLRLDLVNGWLFTIDESRVRDEATRQRVLTYKRECYVVLFQHFYGKQQASQGEVLPPLKPKPYEEWTLEEVRVHLAVANGYRHTLNNASAAWYLMRQGFPQPPDLLMPTWWQADLNLNRAPEGRALVVVTESASRKGSVN